MEEELYTRKTVVPEDIAKTMRRRTSRRRSHFALVRDGLPRFHSFFLCKGTLLSSCNTPKFSHWRPGTMI